MRHFHATTLRLAQEGLRTGGAVEEARYLDPGEASAELEAELGIKPWWALESFRDPAADVPQSIARLRLTPLIPHKEQIRGFVYQTDSGLLVEVPETGAPTAP